MMDFMCQEDDFFKNPAKVPLNELMLEVKTCNKFKKLPKDRDFIAIKDDLYKYYEIRKEKMSALNKHWIQNKHSYVPYQPYYIEVSVKENQDFLTRNKLFLDNLRFLLNCTYQQFWCYIVYEARVINILDSFIKNPISMSDLKCLEKDYLILYENLHETFAKIIMRLLTFKESEVEYMHEDVAMTYLNKSCLFTCAKIIDICILYGQTNVKLIERVMELFFSRKREAIYKNELKVVLNHALLVFDMIGGHICGFESNANVIPLNIRPRPTKFDPYWYEEIVSYILDVAVSLNALFTFCKPSIRVAINMGIPYRMAYFHKNVYEELYKLLKMNIQLPYDWSALKIRIYEGIGLGRSEFVNAFHSIITYLLDNIIRVNKREEQMDFIEQYFKLMLSIFEDDLFAYDYKNAKEIDVQLQMISDLCPDIDQMRINYLLECLGNIPSYKEETKKFGVVSRNVEPAPGTSGTQKTVTMIKERDEQEMENLIREVLDTLPHLGDEFVLKCLEFYNYNPHEVIAAVLDDNLSPVLRDIPQDLIRIPPEPKQKEPILSYRGKKPSYKNTEEMLDDKQAVREVKEFVLKSSNAYYDIYDDEYDDRFDEGIPVHFHERTEEPDLYKYMENRFEGYDVVSDPSSTDDDDDERNDVVKKNQFYEDPASIRARKEMQRRGAPVKENKSHDVVGRAKGQGQEKNVLNNRNKKNVNKSSRANHNRKSGAQWKRNKGMIPS